jgi:hypothetical protein
MNSGNSPDIDPANNESLAGTLQFAFYKLMQNTNGMLPAQVIAYKRETNRVQVQLMIAVMTTQGAQVSRPQLASIPVLALGGGDFFINFNLKKGDLGWVLANDRDISLFLQTYQETAPNTGRVKNFADALFIPDVMKGYTITDTNAMVIQNLAGTVKITLSSDTINITAPNVNINGATTLNLNGNGVISGTLEVEGILKGDSGANLAGTIVLSGLGSHTFTMTP